MKASVMWAYLIIGTFTITAVAPTLILTPYILKNQTELARNLTKVKPELFLNVTSYSGFFTVDQKHNSNLFFWYFPGEQAVSSDTPWIIWLQGGPGVSSLAGLFVEIGPFMYDPKEGLKAREWSWNRKYPILFIDNPVGAGFSFTGSSEGFEKSVDSYSDHLYSAVQQFLELFPERRRAPLYLAGESYAGHYLPTFGYTLLHPPKLTDLKLEDASINLKGIMMGNPVIDQRDIGNMTSMYYQWGLIDTQGMQELMPLQDRYAKAVQENNNTEAYNVRNDLWTKLETRAAQTQSYNVLKGYIPEIAYFKDFIDKPDIREAIHVGDIPFTFSNATVHTLFIKKFLVSSTAKVEELLEHYRIIIYCGQLDMVDSCVSSAGARRKNWRWSGRDAFMAAHRVPWWHQEAVAGYVKSGGNFTEVLVRGAGHLVPMDKPPEAFELIDYFIRALDMPKPPNYVEDTPPYSTEQIDTKERRAEISTNASQNPDSHSNNRGFITSIVFNVIFVVIILAGAILFIRWKRRTDTYFYSMVDNASLNGVLTMD